MNFVDSLKRHSAGAARFVYTGLDRMRNFTQAHCAGHARTTFERVQEAGQRTHRFRTGGIVAPRAHLRGDALTEVDCFLEKDRQQLLVDLVRQLRKVIDRCRRRYRLGFSCVRSGALTNFRLDFGLGRIRRCGWHRSGHDRIQCLQRSNDFASLVWHTLQGHRLKHPAQLADCARYRGNRFAAGALRRIVTPQQGVFECQTKTVDRIETNGGRDPRERVCCPVHRVWRRQQLVPLERGEFPLQRRKMSACLFRKDFVQHRRDGDRLVRPCRYLRHVSRRRPGDRFRRRLGTRTEAFDRRQLLCNRFSGSALVRFWNAKAVVFVRGLRSLQWRKINGDDLGAFLRNDRRQGIEVVLRFFIESRNRHLATVRRRGVRRYRLSKILDDRWNSPPLFTAQTQRIGKGDQCARIWRGTCPGFEETHPIREQRVGETNHVEQRRTDFEFLAQPEVKRLFHRPGRLADVLETDHPAAAFERMEGTTNGRQILEIVRLILQQPGVLFDRGEDLVRLLEEDVEQFGVDFLGACLRQFDRLGRRCGQVGLLRFERSHRLLKLRRCGIASLEDGKHGFGLFCERRIGYQVGIVLQSRQVALEFFAQLAVFRLLLQGIKQRARLDLLLLDLLLDRNTQLIVRDFFSPLRLVGRMRLHSPRELGEVVGAVLHGINEETDHRQAIGDLLEIGFLRFISGIDKTTNLVGAVAQGRDRGVLAHHRQRTDHLFQGNVQTFKLASLGRVTEEAVEDLFDLNKIALDFLGDLSDQQLFLRLPGHLVEQGNLRTGWRQIACDAAVNACNGDVHLMREIVAESLEVLLRVLRQEDSRRNFHGQRFGMTRAVIGQPLRRRRDRLRETAEIGVPQLIDKRRQAVSVLLE